MLFLWETLLPERPSVPPKPPLVQSFQGMSPTLSERDGFFNPLFRLLRSYRPTERSSRGRWPRNPTGTLSFLERPFPQGTTRNANTSSTNPTPPQASWPQTDNVPLASTMHNLLRKHLGHLTQPHIRLMMEEMVEECLIDSLDTDTVNMADDGVRPATRSLFNSIMGDSRNLLVGIAVARALVKSQNILHLVSTLTTEPSLLAIVKKLFDKPWQEWTLPRDVPVSLH